MIAAGMSHPAMIHVVAGFVAAVRRWDEPLPGLCLEIPNRLNDKAFLTPFIMEDRALKAWGSTSDLTFSNFLAGYFEVIASHLL